ncbi:MAG: hypothetical protein MZV64_43200 [Ignavibacteriales bacterium]|nr:hypothetical protein [Ignavibacteriales bacterium]
MTFSPSRVNTASMPSGRSSPAARSMSSNASPGMNFSGRPLARTTAWGRARASIGSRRSRAARSASCSCRRS